MISQKMKNNLHLKFVEVNKMMENEFDYLQELEDVNNHLLGVDE